MIQARTGYAAAMEYQSRIQKILSCVSRSVVKIPYGYNPSAPTSQYLILPGASPVPLAGDHNLMLDVQPYFRVRAVQSQQGHHRVDLEGYHYSIHDGERKEIITYHWHPGRRSFHQAPHLHLGAGAGMSFKALETKPHLPTGHVTFGEIIRFLINDLSVQPLRTDWNDVLDEIVEPVPAP